MKGLLTPCLALLLLCGVSGCKDTKTPKETAKVTAAPDLIDEAPDTTLYGKCGEGTMMNTLELVIEGGDTLTLSLPEDSTFSVKGGLSADDRLAVIVEKSANPDENDKAAVVINLTTLLGKWSALDKTFVLEEGGAVECNVQEPRPITEWKIYNGHLLLSADTFDIYALGADSLYLENKDGIFAYKRMK